MDQQSQILADIKSLRAELAASESATLEALNTRNERMERIETLLTGPWGEPDRGLISQVRKMTEAVPQIKEVGEKIITLENKISEFGRWTKMARKLSWLVVGAFLLAIAAAVVNGWSALAHQASPTEMRTR